MAIFIPIIGLKDDVGQLFSDIALASSSALILSFIICVIVVPSLYYSLAKFLHITYKPDSSSPQSAILVKLTQIIKSILSTISQKNIFT